MNKKIVVVGSNIAGFVAALELKRALGDRHAITVISRAHELSFTPSLGFSMRGPFAKHGIRFCEEEVTRFDLERRRVFTKTKEEPYDHLVIATEPRPNYAAVPGLGPRGYTQSIFSVADAQRAALAFERLLKAPGPVVIGEAPGANSFGAARDFLLGTAERLALDGVDVPIVWLTPGTQPMAVHGVESVTGAVIQRVSREEIALTDGRKYPFAYAMIAPPVLGVDAVRACESITNASGFVLVNDWLQCERYPEVFAAGSAAALQPSVPKSGQLAEEMGRVVAQNIAAQLDGGELVSLPSVERGADPYWARLTYEKYFGSP